MGNIIAVCSQKGGPGKSTLARAVAVAFAKGDWSVKIADTDTKQGSTVAWHQRRLDNNIQPVIAVESFGSIQRALKTADQHDLLVIDGAPHASEATVEAAKAADLVVIPTSLSLDDLEPAVLLAHTLVEKNRIPASRIVLVLSKAGDSAVEIREAREYLSQTPYHVANGEVPEKTAFRRAQDLGQSIIECQHPAPRKKAEAVIQSVIDRFEALTA